MLSGTPTATGTRTFTIRATDGNGAFGSRAYSVTIGAAIVVNPATLPGGSVGSAYSRTISATGGTGTKTFSVSAGALPVRAVTECHDRRHFWNPDKRRVEQLHDPRHRQHRRHRHARVCRHDQRGDHGEPVHAAERNVGNAIQPNNQRHGRYRHVHVQRERRQPGRRARAQRVDRGDLRHADDRGSTKLHDPRDRRQRAFGTQVYSITINAAITVNPATLANGTVGTAYSRTVSATGGTGSYTYSVSAGTLPAGLTLNASSGVISGTPTTRRPARSRSAPPTPSERLDRVRTPSPSPRLRSS